MIITQDELQTVIRQPSGGELNNDGGNLFTLRDALLYSVNKAKSGDSINDSMRMYRLSERIGEARNGPLTLSKTDIDDLKERGHLQWKEKPYIFGPMFSILDRKLDVLDKELETEETEDYESEIEVGKKG